MPTYFIKRGDSYEEISISDISDAEKLVPSKDLLALKGSNESAVKKLESDIESLKSEKDTLLTRATSAESARDELKKEMEPLKTKAESVDSLTTELSALKEKQSAEDTRKLDSARKDIISKYGLKDDKAKQVESMSLADIESMQKSLELVGAGSRNGNSHNNGGFDRQNQNDNVETPRKSFDMIKSALENRDPALRNARGSSGDDD